MTVHEIKRAGKKLQVLDVRAPDEWKDGHIPNARHIFLGELREQPRQTGQDQADGGVLRQRLSREHCDEHFETGRVWLRLQRPRKLASMEESRIPGRKRDREEKEEMNSRANTHPPGFRTDLLLLRHYLKIRD